MREERRKEKGWKEGGGGRRKEKSEREGERKRGREGGSGERERKQQRGVIILQSVASYPDIRSSEFFPCSIRGCVPLLFASVLSFPTSPPPLHSAVPHHQGHQPGFHLEKFVWGGRKMA